MRSTHGLAEAKNAMRMSILLEPVDPEVNVVGFVEAVGRESRAMAVGPGVGKKDSVMIFEEPLAKSVETYAVVADSVKEKYGVAVGVLRAEEPRPKSCAVGSVEFDVLEVFGIGFGGGPGVAFFSGSDGVAAGMESNLGEADTCDYDEQDIKDDQDCADSPEDGMARGARH